MRVRYPDSDWPDEVIAGGEAFFVRSGRVLIYEAPTRVLELNPARALQSCRDAMQRDTDRVQPCARFVANRAAISRRATLLLGSMGTSLLANAW